MTIVKQFGTEIAKKRAVLELSQQSVANDTGISRSLLSFIELGERYDKLPEKYIIEKLGRVLKMNMDKYLVTDSDIIARFPSDLQDVLRNAECTEYVMVTLAKFKADRENSRA